MSIAALGVDVGGSSIKHGLVDTGTGQMLGALQRTATPVPPDAQSLLRVINAMAAAESAQTPVGVAVPLVIQKGVVHLAANLDSSLLGMDIVRYFAERMARPVALLNDADAAGLAEVRVGAARGVSGTVMVLTFGTGIGSALFSNGHLVPNMELGHMEVAGHEAEARASARARTEENLDWPEWADRVNLVLDAINRLFWPELIVIGGGVSDNYAKFGSLLRSRATVLPAKLGPAAGVVGAALAAAGHNA